MKLKHVRKVVFDEFTHSYLCGDKVLIGVTTLMKHQGLAPDYSGIDETALKNAAQRGTSVHTLFEVYDNGEPAIPQDVVSNIDGKVLQTKAEQETLLKEYKKLGLNVLCSEYLVTDGKLVASFLDKVLYVDENTVDLADVKTTSSFHDESVSWQLSIYKYMFERQNKGIKVRNLYGIHARNGKVRLIQVAEKSMDTIKEIFDAEGRGEVFGTANELPSAVAVFGDSLVQVSEAEKQLVAMKATMKELEATLADARATIYTHMVENNINEMAFDGGTIKLKKPYQTTKLDSKKLKENYPDIAAECSVTSEVKGSITFNFTDNA